MTDIPRITFFEAKTDGIRLVFDKAFAMNDDGLLAKEWWVSWEKLSHLLAIAAPKNATKSYDTQEVN